MVGENISLSDVINSTEIASSFIGALPPKLMERVFVMVDIAKILLVIFIIYFLVVIFSKILSSIAERNNSKNLKRILLNVEEINHKLGKPHKKKE
ncbi:hypothetical protein HY450_02750 [Candidatus Pacearchaeota archaeon]|nr:hypothetical protein [Candidatus Pacearchaeota archaeon]